MRTTGGGMTVTRGWAKAFSCTYNGGRLHFTNTLRGKPNTYLQDKAPPGAVGLALAVALAFAVTHTHINAKGQYQTQCQA